MAHYLASEVFTDVDPQAETQEGLSDWAWSSQEFPVDSAYTLHLESLDALCMPDGELLSFEWRETVTPTAILTIENLGVPFYMKWGNYDNVSATVTPVVVTSDVLTNIPAKFTLTVVNLGTWTIVYSLTSSSAVMGYDGEEDSIYELGVRPGDVISPTTYRIILSFKSEAGDLRTLLYDVTLEGRSADSWDTGKDADYFDFYLDYNHQVKVITSSWSGTGSTAVFIASELRPNPNPNIEDSIDHAWIIIRKNINFPGDDTQGSVKQVTGRNGGTVSTHVFSLGRWTDHVMEFIKFDGVWRRINLQTL